MAERDVVVAIDPGSTTGMVKVVRISQRYSLSHTGVEDSLSGVYRMLRELVEGEPNVTVVIENFRLMAAKRASLTWDELFPVKVIGAVELLVEQRATVLRRVFQEPSAKKFYQSVIRLYDAPWTFHEKDRIQHMTEHERDALRHALYYFEFGGGKLAPQGDRER